MEGDKFGGVFDSMEKRRTQVPFPGSVQTGSVELDTSFPFRLKWLSFLNSRRHSIENDFFFLSVFLFSLESRGWVRDVCKGKCRKNEDG